MKKLLLIPAIIFFAGCSNNLSLKEKSKNICLQEPVWILKPPVKQNFIYGVGIAPENFNGEQAQRKSAISKAINEIASQLNTDVNAQTIIHSTLHNKNVSTFVDNVSFQTVKGENVRAKIIKFCKNPSTGYLYVLMQAKK